MRQAEVGEPGKRRLEIVPPPPSTRPSREVRRIEGASAKRMKRGTALSGRTLVGGSGTPGRAFGRLLFPRLNWPRTATLTHSATRRAHRTASAARSPETLPARPTRHSRSSNTRLPRLALLSQVTTAAIPGIWRRLLPTYRPRAPERAGQL